MNYQRAREWILERLRTELPDDLYYHGPEHTLDVLEAAETLAGLEGVGGDDAVALRTAALFHDSGFLRVYDGHEEAGMDLASEVLPRFGYAPEQIAQIRALIAATRLPQSPRTALAEILCDADLDYLGREDYPERAESLRRELAARGRIGSDGEWLRVQIDFLADHSYFTASARVLRDGAKRERLERLRVLAREGE